jgi:hypothetical protein
MLHSTVIGIVGLAAAAASWVLAVVLYRVGMPGSMARKLSLLLLIEGAVLITSGYIEETLRLMPVSLGDPAYPIIGAVNFSVHHLGDAAMLFLYPAFLAAALKTRLTRPFARKSVLIPIAILGLAMAIGTVISVVLWQSPAGSLLLYVSMLLMFVFALVASIHAWRTAEPGLARTRAGVFAVAFGIRDVCWGFAYAAAFWMLLTDYQGEPVYWLVRIVYAGSTLLAVPLIAYGILRGHLFDIDLRIRWTIKQSTLAGLIIAIIFLISEGASEFISAELGTVAGLLTAAVLIFFLTPLQQFAERVAASAMPNTENTPTYVAFRKMQVYENALVEALEEGGVSAKERSLLNRLRESLEISEADARAIEEDVQARLTPADDSGMQAA